MRKSEQPRGDYEPGRTLAKKSGLFWAENVLHNKFWSNMLHIRHAAFLSSKLFCGGCIILQSFLNILARDIY